MAVKKTTEKIEWTYQGKKDFTVPPLAIGFTYLIEIIGTPFYYYGKKNLTSTRGRGKKAVTKESNWRNYESSSKEVKQLVKNGAIIKKSIIKFCFSKAELSLEEARLIICNNGLEDSSCLNRWISLKVWQHQLTKGSNGI
jgi:hypothetical protein